MQGIFDWIKDKLGDILEGLLGGFIDWAIEFLGNIVEKLSLIIDAIFSIFANVPRIAKGFDTLLGAVLWFVPPEAFPVIYVCVAIVFIAALFRWIWKK